MAFFSRIKLKHGAILGAQRLLRSTTASATLLTSSVKLEVMFPLVTLTLDAGTVIDKITLTVNGSGSYSVSAQAFREVLTSTGEVARGIDHLKELRNILSIGSRWRTWTTEDYPRAYGDTVTAGSIQSASLENGVWNLAGLALGYQHIGFALTLTGTPTGKLDEITVNFSLLGVGGTIVGENFPL